MTQLKSGSRVEIRDELFRFGANMLFCYNSGFEASDAFFNGVVQRFTEEEERWMKGRRLQTGLPFRPRVYGKN